jgi:hypothetical protein
MLTHMHMVVYTRWCWHICKDFERKRKVETLSPSCRACSTGFGEETEAHRSLEVIERWPRGHLCVRSVQAEARVKELSERTLAKEHLRIWSVSVEERTLRTGLWLNTVQCPVTLMWWCTVRSGRTGRWPASSHGAPDVSDGCSGALGALCCTMDAEA